MAFTRRPDRLESATAAYEATTRGVVVRVRPRFLADQSSEEDRRWVWAYAVEIANTSDVTVQLVSRRWTITDARGRVEIVEGPGVVGEQPVLAPGDTFSYASGCPLPTSSGAMVGVYQMTVEGGEPFEAAIPAFSLDAPGAARTLN